MTWVAGELAVRHRQQPAQHELFCRVAAARLRAETRRKQANEALTRAVVLALFVPLIISSGGNSGSQASTLVIRALALGEVDPYALEELEPAVADEQPDEEIVVLVSGATVPAGSNWGSPSIHDLDDDVERAEVDPVDRDRALGRLVQPGEDVHERRFARPRGSHDRRQLAALYVLADGSTTTVGELADVGDEADACERGHRRVVLELARALARAERAFAFALSDAFGAWRVVDNRREARYLFEISRSEWTDAVRDAQRSQNSRLIEGIERWRAPLIGRGAELATMREAWQAGQLTPSSYSGEARSASLTGQRQAWHSP